VSPLLFISALILGPLFGLLAGVAIGLWWANRSANDSRQEALDRSYAEWQVKINRNAVHPDEAFDQWAKRIDGGE
jgi:hypothetical protein